MPASARPSVDVVVPCYNYARYLERCVGSVLSQDGVDVRVLIIDDVSKDNSVEVAERLAAADARVSVLRHTVNKGLVGTANDGVIGWASAKYTLLLSADDALTQGALRRAVSVMEAHPEVGMTYGLALIVSDDGEMAPTEDPSAFDYRVMTGAEFLERACTRWCGVASPTALIRTEVQHLVGGLDPNLPHTCDMEIWMRISTRASVAAINATQAYYRRHDANMSTEYMNKPLSDLREQLATANAVLSGWGKDIPGAAGWMRAMKARLVEQACWMAGLAFERGDEEGARACIAFAEENRPDLWLSKAWLRYRAKRLVGRSLIHALRARANRRTMAAPDFSPFAQGARFGWWPEFGASARMTL